MNGANAALVRAIRGPIMLITIGVLFTLDKFTSFSFTETWPALLIVLGAMILAERSAARTPPPGAGEGGWR